MPASPKFGNIPGEVGIGKVSHQVKTQKTGGSYGNIGVTREITIYLKSKKQGTQNQGAA